MVRACARDPAPRVRCSSSFRRRCRHRRGGGGGPRMPAPTGSRVVNTLPGLLVDVERRRPALGFGTGGVSGSALLPIGILATWRVYRATRAPIIGVGGIARAEDVLQYLIAGASAVAVGTAALRDPRLPERVVADLASWCSAGHCFHPGPDGNAGVARMTATPIVALDVATLDDALALVDRLGASCRLLQGGKRAVHGGGTGDAGGAAHSREAGLPRPEAARHTEHGARGGPRRRIARGIAAHGACRGRRGDAAGGGGRRGSFVRGARRYRADLARRRNAGGRLGSRPRRRGRRGR